MTASPPGPSVAAPAGAPDGHADGGDGETTTDALLLGRLTLVQPVRGFRSSLDPALLAGFLRPPFGRFLDVGCGTGALSFLLLAGDSRATGLGVEIQQRLARLAASGRDRSGFGGRLEIVTGDVRRLGRTIGAAGFDLVAANPPFLPVARGRASPDSERALANHEITLSLAECLDVARAAVRPGGRVALIHAAERAGELLAELGARGLPAVRLRPVYPRALRPAVRVLVEARRGRYRPLLIEPPLVVHEGSGYTTEVRRMLGEL